MIKPKMTLKLNSSLQKDFLQKAFTAGWFIADLSTLPTTITARSSRLTGSS